MKLSTKSLSEWAHELLAPDLEPLGFKYFKSFEHFRRKHPQGISYVQLNTVTHNRSDYYLAFYPAVRWDSVETTIQRIWGETRKLGHYDRSIWLYTVNVGPTSPHWNYPIRGNWDGESLQDFDAQSASIREFASDLMLPFVQENEDLENIRHTLLEWPGHATNLYPYEQILVSSIVTNNFVRLRDDRQLLQERYKDMGESFRSRFLRFLDRMDRFLTEARD